MAGISFAGNTNGTPASGSNQFISMMPSMPTPTGTGNSNNTAMPASPSIFSAMQTSPYVAPPPSGGGSGMPTFGSPAIPVAMPAGQQSLFNPIPNGMTPNGQQMLAPGMTNTKIGPNMYTESPQYPGLSSNLSNFLSSQVGQGVPIFNQSTQLPTGGLTQGGALSAPMNQLLSQLFGFYNGGSSSTPGASTLANIANNGISALPEWQSMIQAQQQNIGQNQANLQEQFASMGGLAGSPFGTAMSNFASQTTADQNALLGQLQQQNILQGQMPAAQSLLSDAGAMSQYGQSLDQQAIQNMLQEFNYTLPQNNPLNQEEYGLSTTYAPIYNTTSGQGVLGGLLSNIGSIAGMGSSMFSGGSSAAAGGAGTLGTILAGLLAI